MKRIVKNIFIFFTILCVSTAVLGNTIVMAEELSVSAVYQQSTNSWKIEGTAGSKAHTAVTLKIYRSENGGFSEDALVNKEGIVKLVYTSEGGAFTDSINFGTFFSSGSYTVEAICSGFTAAITSFLYVNPDEAASIIDSINNASTVGEVSQLLGENCYQLGIDEEEYTAKAQCIDEIIFNRKPSEGYTTQSFLKEYNSALCVYDLKNSTDTLEEILQKHSESVNFNYEEDIAVHGSNVVLMLRERLKTQNYNTLSPDRAIEENLIVSRILCAERYTYIEGIIKDEILGDVYDLSDYNNVKNTENVFKALYNNKDDIKNYEDIKTVFEASAEAALKAENSGSSGGGGGGGGSSSGGSAVGKKEDISITEVKTETPEKDVLTESYFSDTKNHWASKYIEYMADNKIANGYPDGSFKPEGFVTRAEFVKFVTVAFKLSQMASDNIFEDVKKDDWFAKYVSNAVSNGIIMGFEGKFRPNDSISRQDAAVILGRLTENVDESYNSAFNDENEISEYALSSVKKLAAMGIINGINNDFLPARNITRAEAAAMIVRLLEE